MLRRRDAKQVGEEMDVDTSTAEVSSGPLWGAAEDTELLKGVRALVATNRTV